MKKINKKALKKTLKELMEGIVFLPLHSGNVERVERVKRVWIGRGLYEKPKVFGKIKEN